MSTKKSHYKRNHHELPELYLRGFCDEPSFLWVYERGKTYNLGIQKKHKFNPCKLGVTELGEKDRYAKVNPNGERDFESIENRLQKIEHKADNILRKIRSQEPISLNEKETFAEYTQMIQKRTKAREKTVNRIIEKIQKSPERNNIALSLAQSGNFEAARKHYDAQKYLESDNGKRILVLESMVRTYPQLHQILKSMSWIFYVAASESYFVTSSAPVAFDPVGLSVSSLLFPISRNIALIATHEMKTDLAYLNTSLDETLMINFYTIINAPSVYSPKPEILDLGYSGTWPCNDKKPVVSFK